MRTLLSAEYLADNLLLLPPHRLLTFAIPKILRPFFRLERTLFSHVSILIFEMVQSFFSEAARSSIDSGAVVADQSSPSAPSPR